MACDIPDARTHGIYISAGSLERNKNEAFPDEREGTGVVGGTPARTEAVRCVAAIEMVRWRVL